MVENTNEEIFKQIESGNINRDFIFETFKGLGETVEHHGFNPSEKRNLTYQQYFTPYPVMVLFRRCKLRTANVRL